MTIDTKISGCLTKQFGERRDVAAFDKMQEEFGVGFSRADQSANSLASAIPTKTMTASLGCKYTKPSITSFSSNNVAQVKGAAQKIESGKGVICESVRQGQEAVKACAQALNQDVGELYPNIKSDDGTIVMSAALDAACGGGTLATFLTSCAPSISVSQDKKIPREEFEDMLKTAAQMAQPSVLEKASMQGPQVAEILEPSGNILQLLQDGHEIKALMDLDPNEPNLPEFKELEKLEGLSKKRLAELAPTIDGQADGVSVVLASSTLLDFKGVKVSTADSFNVAAEAKETTVALNDEFKLASKEALYGGMAMSALGQV